ncbi:MAG: hypothetical protein ACLR0U_16080 [Enterocloster clostridioformis]
MRRIAAILCSAAILVSYPGIAALGQEPEIAIPWEQRYQGAASMDRMKDGQEGMCRRRRRLRTRPDSSPDSRPVGYSNGSVHRTGNL